MEFTVLFHAAKKTIELMHSKWMQIINSNRVVRKSHRHSDRVTVTYAFI